MFNINFSIFSRAKVLEADIDRFHDKLINISLVFTKTIKIYLKEGLSSNFKKHSKEIKGLL
jgi:hypothetical protein